LTIKHIKKFIHQGLFYEVDLATRVQFHFNYKSLSHLFIKKRITDNVYKENEISYVQGPGYVKLFIAYV